jgi:Ser/Thr protein kinase RdoA (MazF antagonist)
MESRVTAPPDGLVRAVEERYALGPITVRERLEGGYANDVFLVDSATGPLVLRIEHPPIDVASIAWEHRLVARLARELPEVPAPLGAADGTTFFHSERFAVWLLPFVAGTPAERADARHREAAARLLARLHATGAKLTVAKRPGHPRLADLPFPPVGALPAEIEPLRGVLARGREEAVELVSEIARTRSLVTGVVHGDFFRGNILKSRRRVTALLDWEEATVDWLTFELANGVWEFCKRYGDDDLDRDAAADFVAAYRDEGGVAAAEDDDLLVPFIRVKRTLEVLRAPTDRHVDWDYQLHNLRAAENLG